MLLIKYIRKDDHVGHDIGALRRLSMMVSIESVPGIPINSQGDDSSGHIPFFRFQLPSRNLLLCTT